MDYLQKAKKIKWRFFNQRRRSPFFNWLAIKSLTIDTKIADLGANSSSWVTVDGWNGCLPEDFESLRLKLVKSLENNPAFLLEVIDSYKKKHDQSLKLWEKIGSANWEKTSSNDLIETLKKYMASREEIDPVLNLPVIIEGDLEIKLRDEIEKIFPNDPEAYNALTSPIYPSTQSEEASERGKIKTEKDLEAHWQKYRWISDTLLFLDYLPREYFKKKAASEANFHKEFDAYYEKISNPSVQTLVNTIQKSIWFRNFRIESFYYSTYIILNFLKEIAKRLDLPVKKLVYLTPPEIINLLQNGGKPDLKEIEERKTFVFYFEPGVFEVYSGDEAQKWIKTLKPGYKSESKNLTGQIAFAGVLKGKVVIIHNVEELPKLLKKEYKDAILVTHGTNPQYVPYLKNIKGIITDEGGLLCHAAIISREMNKPCIIGTKIATNILHDGDMVEVDADKGIVRILKS